MSKDLRHLNVTNLIMFISLHATVDNVNFVTA